MGPVTVDVAGCVDDRSVLVAWCCRVNMDQNLRNVFEFMLVLEVKGNHPCSRKLYLIK